MHAPVVHAHNCAPPRVYAHYSVCLLQLHLHGDALEAAGITPQLLMRNMRALIRHYLVKAELATQRQEAEAAGEQQHPRTLATGLCHDSWPMRYWHSGGGLYGGQGWGCAIL